MTEHDDDAELRARLRAADPAAALPPATEAGVARLLEDTMSEDVPTETRQTGTHQRSPLTWLVAAAAAVIIAGAATFAVLNRDGGTEPPATAGNPTVTELHAPDAAAYQSRCMVPNAQTLSGHPTAFDGTVEQIDGDLVTLSPTHWYAGEPTDLVTVEAPSAELQRLLSAVEFEDGGRYLVAADDSGRVMVCGFSAPWSRELAAIYGDAFGS